MFNDSAFISRYVLDAGTLSPVIFYIFTSPHFHIK